jgi:hypothetical protein
MRPRYSARMQQPLLADMIWPALYVTGYFYASWAVLVGLACECAVFRFWLKFSWKRAALAAVVVNAIPAGLGLFLIPLSGLAWAFRAPRTWRVFGIVLGANALSVGFAFVVSLFMKWPTM